MPLNANAKHIVISSDPTRVDLSCTLIYIRQNLVIRILTKTWYTTVDLTITQYLWRTYRQLEQTIPPPTSTRPNLIRQSFKITLVYQTL